MEPLSRHTECPRCKTPFECKFNDIQNCQCNSVLLDDKEREFISQYYNDCLCGNCIADLKAEYHNKVKSD
jgi:hypothetical protein